MIRLAVTISRRDGSAVFDFTGTSPQVHGNTNAPRAVTYSAVIYCLRCLVQRSIPLNQGCLTPVRVIIPSNTILNPSPDAAVVGGNVLTSQRVTDVVLKVQSSYAIVCYGERSHCNFHPPSERISFFVISTSPLAYLPFLLYLSSFT